MFEEKAKEYVIKKHNIDITKQPVDFSLRCEFAEDFTDFQRGAEFGYNKAKEEMQEQGLALQSDMDKTIEQNIALKKELEEANEWHYVKDGDLPKVNELVLIKITGCFVLGWTNGTNWFNDSNNGTIIDRRMVIAWKEIVLPKEIKNEL